jgi:hypothetical protein
MPFNVRAHAHTEGEISNPLDPVNYGRIAARTFMHLIPAVASRYKVTVPPSYYRLFPSDPLAFILAAGLENVPTLGLMVVVNSAWQGGYNPKMLNPNSKCYPEALARLALYGRAARVLNAKAKYTKAYSFKGRTSHHSGNVTN